MANWKHGWIPLTPAAVASKNHGKTPGSSSKLGKKLAGMKTSPKPAAPKPAAPKTTTKLPAGMPPPLTDDELRDLGKTPAGRRKLRERQRQIDEAKSRTARDAAARAGFPGPQRKKPYRKPAKKRR